LSSADTGTRARPRTEVIRDIGTLRGLEPSWRLAAVEAGNVFLTPDWYLQHLEAQPAHRPAAVAIYGDAGEVAALIPLVDDGRTVRFPGAAFGDRFGALTFDRTALDPTAVWRHASAALGRIADRRLIVLDRLDAPTRLRVRGALTFAESAEVLPYISLRSATYEDWLARRSGNFRSQIKRKLQRLARAADVRFVEVRDAAAAQGVLRVHFDLHYHRRESVGDQSSLASDVARRFHFGLVQRLASHGWLRLWLLECDEVPIASWYGWHIGSTYAYYQAGFDATWAEYSPGTLLMIKTVAAAFDEGAAEYDLLLGDEQYKQRFTVEDRRVHTTVIGRAMSPSFLGAYGFAGIRRVYRLLPADVRSLTRRAVGPHVGSRLVDGPRDS
jgi:CelD/BcsL family acetyltransferase involved in cellulose biosynthesis